MTNTEILVCVLCRPAGAPREAPRAGRALFEAVQEAAFLEDLPFSVRPVECMNGCSRSCTVALQAPGKSVYFFGDLTADAETARQVLACAQMHQTSPDGSLLRAERPERLREGILARLPACLPAA
jgi:predicted metal-binding protein